MHFQSCAKKKKVSVHILVLGKRLNLDCHCDGEANVVFFPLIYICIKLRQKCVYGEKETERGLIALYVYRNIYVYI